jgi:hypothetical protein
MQTPDLDFFSVERLHQFGFRLLGESSINFVVRPWLKSERRRGTGLGLSPTTDWLLMP